MATKRARITDRDPLTATDSVLAGYEQVNKSASQQADDSLLTSQQPNQLTSQEVEIVAATDRLAAQGGRQPAVDKLASQQVSNLESQQVNKLASQEVGIVKSSVQKPEMDKSTSEEVSKLESLQVNKLTSKEVGIVESIVRSVKADKIESQEVSKLTSKEVNKLTSKEVELVESASQQVNKLTSEEVELVESSVQQAETDNLASQQVSKPTIRKATFQIDAAILEALDRYHLQLQIDLGKRNAPYKEILVEEAIAQWLERAAKSPERAVKSLLKRQEQR
jgi:hypothetical protein